MSNQGNMMDTAQARMESVSRHSAVLVGIFGAVTVVVGVLAMIWPGKTVVVLELLFGIQLVVAGIIRFVEGLARTEESGGTRTMLALLGVLSVIVGVWAMRHLGLTVLTLALVLGIYWIIHGMIEVFVAITDHGAEYRGTRATLGVLSVLAGIVLVAWPGVSLAALAWVTGLWLVVLGIGELALAFRLRRHGAAMGPAAPIQPRPA